MGSDDHRDSQDVASTFAQVARVLAGSQGEKQTLEAVTRLAVEAIAHCDHAGISLVAKGGRIDTRASTDELVRRLDQAQAELGEGPCMDSLRDHESVRVDDLGNDPRWPRFGPRAHDEGIGSIHSFRLFVEKDTVGALNLYARSTHAFTDADQPLGEAFAAHAAIALTHARSEAGLRAALESRELIGQAQGILMERERLTPEQAFSRLREASQHRNVKLLKIAEDVVETGALPTLP